MRAKASQFPTLFDEGDSPAHVLVLVDRIARVPEPEGSDLRADVEGFRPVAEPGRVEAEAKVVRCAPPQAGIGRYEEQRHGDQERGERRCWHLERSAVANAKRFRKVYLRFTTEQICRRWRVFFVVDKSLRASIL